MPTCVSAENRQSSWWVLSDVTSDGIQEARATGSVVAFTSVLFGRTASPTLAKVRTTSLTSGLSRGLRRKCCCRIGFDSKPQSSQR